MTQERTWLRETVVFVLVAVLALVVSFTFVFPRHWSRGFLGPDEAWHADLARHVLAGDGYVSSTLFPMDAPSTEGFPVTESLKQSGLALTTVAVWWVFGESERAVIVIVMLTFAVGVGLTQLLAYRLTRHRGVALLVAGLVLANPAVLSTMLTALPVSLVFTTFVLLLLLVVEPTPQRLVLAGLVYVALLLAKGYGILYFLPIVGYLAATSRGVKMPLLFGGSVVLWVVAAQLTLPAGSFRLVNSGANYALAFLHEWRYPQTVYAFRDLAPPDPWTVIAEHPREFAVHYHGEYALTGDWRVERRGSLTGWLGRPSGLCFPRCCGWLWSRCQSIGFAPGVSSRRWLRTLLLSCATLISWFCSVRRFS